MLTDRQFEQMLREAVAEWQETDEYKGLDPDMQAMAQWLRVNAEVREGKMHAKTAEVMKLMTIGSTKFEATHLEDFIRHSVERGLRKVFR